MGKDHRLSFIRPTLLVLVIAAAVAGCGGVSAPDVISWGRVEITGPEDGSLTNSRYIDVRGRAELGTLVRVYVDGVFGGSGRAFQTQPPQELGTFRVEDVDLGLDETVKTIVAVAGDEEGNTADVGDTVSVLLDLTPPPAELERIDGAVEVEPDVWEAPDTPVDVYARTDTTAIIVRVRWQSTDYMPEDYEVFPGVPGEPDSVRVRFSIGRPLAGPALRDTSRVYALQTIDAAENYTQTFFTIRWMVASAGYDRGADAGPTGLGVSPDEGEGGRGIRGPDRGQDERAPGVRPAERGAGGLEGARGRNSDRMERALRTPRQQAKEDSEWPSSSTSRTSGRPWRQSSSTRGSPR